MLIMKLQAIISNYIPNVGAKMVTNVNTYSSTDQDTQSVLILNFQTAISNISVVFNLVSLPAITNINFSKYPRYIYLPII